MRELIKPKAEPSTARARQFAGAEPKRAASRAYFEGWFSRYFPHLVAVRTVQQQPIPDRGEERQRLMGAIFGGRPPAHLRCTKRLGRGGNTGRYCWGWREPGTDRCHHHARAPVSTGPVQAVRREMVDGGEISHHETRIGADGVAQPASKPGKRVLFQAPTPSVVALDPPVAEVTVARASIERRLGTLRPVHASRRWSMPADPVQRILAVALRWKRQAARSSSS